MTAPLRPTSWRVELWRAITPRSVPDAVGMVLLAVAIVAYHVVLRRWYIEDAAISFAYARNLAEGLGLVPFAGGERVEGYSNPLWVAVLAGFQLLGIDGFASAKILGSVLYIGAVHGVYALTREAVGERLPHAPLLAAVLATVNAQGLVWSASGLENPLFAFLLTWGAWALVVEGRTRHAWPLSAAVFAALALTRPEGVAYGLIAGLLATWLAYRRGRVAAVLPRWLLLFAVPVVAHQVFRQVYFAYPHPNTYYAKLGPAAAERVWRWETPGWRYLCRYGFETGRAFVAPLMGLGLWSGHRHAWLGFVGGLAAGAVMLQPEWLVGEANVVVLVGVGVLGPVVAAALRRPDALVVAGALAVMAAAFAVLANGDWMRNYRWFANFAPMGSVLLAVGILDIAGRMAAPAAVRGALVAVLVSGSVAMDAWMIREWPMLTKATPFMVRSRLRMLEELSARIGIEDRVRLLTVDQGAFLWWSDFEMMDKGALIDVPTAHGTRLGMPFFRHYVLEDRRPHYLSAHQFVPVWLERPEFAAAYIPFMAHREWYALRRDLVLAASWEGDSDIDGVLELGEGLWLEGVRLASGEVFDRLELRVGLRADGASAVPEDLVLTLVDDAGTALARWKEELGYELVTPDQWGGDVFLAHVVLEVPADLPRGGPYALDLAVRTREGELLRGEGALARISAAVTLLEPDEAAARSEEVVAEALRRAAEGDCEGARVSWRHARAILWSDAASRVRHRPVVDAAVARCLVREGGADAVLKGCRMAPYDPEVRPACVEAADAAEASGERAAGAGRWWDAFAGFDRAVRLDPTRAAARRQAEEARGRALRGGRGP